jgi:hypothetical protein
MPDNTTVFGWPYPLSSDLVRDGAEAIEDLAEAVETTLLSGAILQVVSTTKTDVFTTTSASYVDVTGLTLNITPKTATNKILLIASMPLAVDSGTSGQTVHAALFNSTTNLIVPDAPGNRTPSIITPIYDGAGNDSNMWLASFCLLHSPASTSAQTYSMRVRVGNATSVHVNQSDDDGDSATNARGVSTITALEVGA